MNVFDGRHTKWHNRDLGAVCHLSAVSCDHIWKFETRELPNIHSELWPLPCISIWQRNMSNVFNIFMAHSKPFCFTFIDLWFLTFSLCFYFTSDYFYFVNIFAVLMSAILGPRLRVILRMHFVEFQRKNWNWNHWTQFQSGLLSSECMKTIIYRSFARSLVWKSLTMCQQEDVRICLCNDLWIELNSFSFWDWNGSSLHIFDNGTSIYNRSPAYDLFFSSFPRLKSIMIGE